MSSRSQLTTVAASNVPKHVAIIMDGNGRWAKQRGKLRVFGHRAGVRAVRKSVRFAVEQGLTALTLYAFSSENWLRPAHEVSALMELFVHALENEVKSLHKHQVRLRVIGDKSRFNSRLQQRIAQAEALTADNQRLTLNIAANYGGRWDIVQAVKQLMTLAEQQHLAIADINEQLLEQYLCLQQSPPVDLVIRTGGEHRISNFLLWQIAYAELYFTEILWPDFDEAVFAQAITAFSQRERRFGGANPDLTTL